MLDPEARQEIDRAPADARCTFVLEWREQPDEGLFSPAASKRERLQRLITFYREGKAPIVHQLSTAGVDVTDLPTSPQMVATAPAKTWRTLLSMLESHPDVAVLPNRVYTAISG